MLRAALDYAASGRRVHPCDPRTKRPLSKWGSEASTEPLQLRLWWAKHPDALIGLCTGDGLVVVDVDPRHGGTFDAELARTLTAQTPGGGWHHYFATGAQVGNAVNLLPGVDIRGEGGYVIAPGSPGYNWINDEEILPLPGWVYDALSKRSRATRLVGGFEPSERVAEGGRNDYIARFAGYAIRMGFDDEAELVQLCREHNTQVCVPPLDDTEVGRTARSILRRHERS